MICIFINIWPSLDEKLGKTAMTTIYIILFKNSRGKSIIFLMLFCQQQQCLIQATAKAGRHSDGTHAEKYPTLNALNGNSYINNKAYDIHRKWLTPTKMKILCLTPKTSNILKINLDISFIIYLVITKKKILYNYYWYSYIIQKTFITCFIYIKKNVYNYRC